MRMEGRSLTDPDDIRVDEVTFLALCDHVGQDMYSRDVRYYGVSDPDAVPDSEKRNVGKNCIDNSYQNVFIFDTDSFDVYVLRNNS